MTLNLSGAVTRNFARSLLVAQKHSPTILFAAGVVGVVATTVTACKATLKLEEVISEASENLETAKNLQHDDYSERDRQKDVAYIYIQSAAKLGKLYGPSIILGSLSIAALSGSHNILTRRNAALTAAYAAIEKSFKDYRKRVISEFGSDKDRELRYGTETKSINITDANGNTKKKTVSVVSSTSPSPYARFFDETNRNWSPTPEYNVMFLRGQQNWANDRLRARGHLTLNDVYDELGLERTKAGFVVGWLWDNENAGDGYVDFGIFSDNSLQRMHDFVTGREGVILLDFNVDGVIYDKI